MERITFQTPEQERVSANGLISIGDSFVFLSPDTDEPQEFVFRGFAEQCSELAICYGHEDVNGVYVEPIDAKCIEWVRSANSAFFEIKGSDTEKGWALKGIMEKPNTRSLNVVKFLEKPTGNEVMADSIDESIAIALNCA